MLLLIIVLDPCSIFCFCLGSTCTVEQITCFFSFYLILYLSDVKSLRDLDSVINILKYLSF